MSNNLENNLFVHSNRFPTSKLDYTVQTPMMEDVFEIVLAEVEKMEIGITLYGTSRFGKTRAMDYIEEAMKKQSPSVTVARSILITRSHDSDKKFYEHMLVSINQDENCIVDGDNLRTRIVQFFIVHCSEKQDPRLLLMIDEAQRLTVKNCSYLIDLTNQLEFFGISPTVLLMGQPELLDLKNQLLRLKRMDVVGRFFDNPIMFEAVTTEDILRAILRQYDDHLKMAFPRGSNTCITAAYVPNLYAKGFRLENATNVLWKAFVESAEDLKIRPIVGMRSLTRVVEMGLTDLAISLNVNNASSYLWWKGILLASGYLVHLRTMSGPRNL